MEQGGKERTPVMQLQRLANYRVVTWGDEVMRSSVERLWTDYVRWVEKNQPEVAATQAWREALRSWCDDIRMEQLYFGDSAPAVVAGLLPTEITPWCFSDA